jgi:hypothetical protein
LGGAAGCDRVHRLALRETILNVSVSTCVPRPVRDDPRAGPRGDGRDPHPDEAREGDYDLVCIGSPTWWLKTSVPIRSYLKSDAAGRILDGKRFAAFVVCRRYWSINMNAVKKLAKAQGGDYVDGAHWAFAGGQVKSLLSLLSYLGKGEHRERYLGVKIPPPISSQTISKRPAGSQPDSQTVSPRDKPHDPPQRRARTPGRRDR